MSGEGDTGVFAGRTAPLLSVVVIGRNEGERLRRCFFSLAALPAEIAPFETLYVDSGSSDGSVATAEASGAKVFTLHPRRPTAALGRNAGWRAASGDFVLFLDGDTELVPGFLPASLARMADPELAVVWGHRREAHPENSLYNRVLDLDWIYPAGPAEFCGGDALFRRSALLETGGFDETLIAGEEPELCRRIRAGGGRILHIDEPMTTHDLQITRFAQYWRRAKRAGHAYAEVSARFADTSERFWSEDAKRNRRHAAVLLFGSVAMFSLSVSLRSLLPVVLWSLLLALLTARTAWRARWKSRDAVTLLLYGVHSHLQQIPIFAGQLEYFLSRRRGQRRGLVEYRKR